ncbi:hypothetical protein HU200_016414 [Digitaria exilis]|uniref:Fucosyltransferase n=1 Tax=Digitaria exilis TaxID=1010633 RepID=A0A835F8C5_9POAL|nr:hypothetical protein HU200_016414 [Digitaria exilis]
MEMEKMIASGGDGGVPELEDPVVARPAAEEEKESRRRRPLLVAVLAALLLLAFFVLGRESTSTVWEMASAKLLAVVNNDAAAATHHHDDGELAGNVTNRNDVDELLGGLLTAGMDRRSCRSRYESSWYYKHFPYKPSTHLLGKLRAYEARHRRCAPGTPLYAMAVDHLKSGGGADEAAMEECRYIVWLPFDGLGNRMLSMASGFLYALLTDRVFLVALPPDSDELFCEPFPDTTWRLPLEDFPIANLFNLGPNPDVSLTALLNSKKIVVDVDDTDDQAAVAATPLPAYVYLSLGWEMTDVAFFCGEHQAALEKVSWLLLYSDLYFVPSLYPIAKFQDELRLLFPAAMESISHLLLRYLFHPSNTVWGMVTRYYHSYLAHADRRIGIQIRMFNFGAIPVDDMYNQILACSRQEHILLETDGGSDAVDDTATATISGGGSDTILVVSLYADYYERLRSRYYEHAAAKRGGDTWVGVFQPTHEERQATESLAHNQKALAEVYLLSFSDELITTGRSTFGYVSSSLAGVRPTILLTALGHKVPETPCQRAVSMDPCNHKPPRGVVCWRGMAVDRDDLARHVRVCEDYDIGVKLFD